MGRKKFRGQEIQHDGETERIVYAKRLWGKKRNDDYTEYRSSFALNNGEYAYRDWDEDNQREFFHVIKIHDPDVFQLLDESDHDEEKDDRHSHLSCGMRRWRRHRKKSHRHHLWRRRSIRCGSIL